MSENFRQRENIAAIEQKTLCKVIAEHLWGNIRHACSIAVNTHVAFKAIDAECAIVRGREQVFTLYKAVLVANPQPQGLANLVAEKHCARFLAFGVFPWQNDTVFEQVYIAHLNG